MSLRFSASHIFVFIYLFVFETLNFSSRQSLFRKTYAVRFRLCGVAGRSVYSQKCVALNKSSFSLTNKIIPVEKKRSTACHSFHALWIIYMYSAHSPPIKFPLLHLSLILMSCKFHLRPTCQTFSHGCHSLALRLSPVSHEGTLCWL